LKKEQNEFFCICVIDAMKDGVKMKNVKPKEESVKLESMKKKDRKKLRKMKSANFETATQAKVLWEECRRFVKRCL